jgi:hypothetical protein
VVHLTLNIAAFALWLLEVIFWAILSVAGWLAAATLVATVAVLAVRGGIRGERRRRERKRGGDREA